MGTAFYDRVIVGWPGTNSSGGISLGAPISGLGGLAFNAGMNGQYTGYHIQHPNFLTEQEAGIALYNSGTNALTVLRRFVPSDGAGAVTFSSGTKEVRNSPIARMLVPNITGGPPTVNDDLNDGYIEGLATWFDSTEKTFYRLLDHTVGAAVWAVVGLGDGDVTSRMVYNGTGVASTPSGGVATVPNGPWSSFTTVLQFSVTDPATNEVRITTPPARRDIEIYNNTGQSITIADEGGTPLLADIPDQRISRWSWNGSSWLNRRAILANIGANSVDDPNLTTGTPFSVRWLDASGNPGQLPKATQAEAEGGVATNRWMDPELVGQAIAALAGSIEWTSPQISTSTATIDDSRARQLVELTHTGGAITVTFSPGTIADKSGGVIKRTTQPVTIAMGGPAAGGSGARYTFGQSGGALQTANFTLFGTLTWQCLDNSDDDSAVYLIEGDTSLNVDILADAEETASFTLNLTHARRKIVRCNHASTGIVVTVPASTMTDFSTGTMIHLARWGPATVTIAAAGGVTIQKPSDKALTARAQYSVISLWHQSTDTWLLFGDLT